MFGKSSNNWTDKVRDKLTAYVDERFEDYRERIAQDLSQGLATLAGLIAIWTVALLCLVFLGIVFSLLLAQILRPWAGEWAYLIGFSGIAILLIGLGSLLLIRRLYIIEKPVFKAMLKALDGHLPEEIDPIAEEQDKE